MIPITSMEPMNAPIMTDRNPDKVNTPAVIVPAPASMTKATPKLAPELIPSMEGSAKGLLNVVCNISPDAASAIPQRRAVMACGRRDSQTMKLQLAFSTSLPVRICHTASAGMFTEPNSKLAPVNARMRRSSMIPYLFLCYSLILFGVTPTVGSVSKLTRPIPSSAVGAALSTF